MSVIDIIKIILLFIVAIVILGIRNCILTHIKKCKQQKLLFSLLCDDLRSLNRDLKIFERIQNAVVKDSSLIVSLAVPPLETDLLNNLIYLDSKNSIFYAELLSLIEIYKTGIEKLFKYMDKRIISNDQNINKRLECMIVAQCEALGIELISMNEKILEIFKNVSKTLFCHTDKNLLVCMTKKIEEGKVTLKKITRHFG